MQKIEVYDKGKPEGRCQYRPQIKPMLVHIRDSDAFSGTASCSMHTAWWWVFHICDVIILKLQCWGNVENDDNRDELKRKFLFRANNSGCMVLDEKSCAIWQNTKWKHIFFFKIHYVHPLAIIDLNIYIKLSMSHQICSFHPNNYARTNPGYTHVYPRVSAGLTLNMSLPLSIFLSLPPPLSSTYSGPTQCVSSAAMENFLSKGHNAKVPFVGRQNQSLVINRNKQNWHV